MLERLAPLTPRPRINLIRRHGVLAPRAAWRSLVVRFEQSTGSEAVSRADVSADETDGATGRAYHSCARPPSAQA